jgi:putative ABC transport system permease protein
MNALRTFISNYRRRRTIIFALAVAVVGLLLTTFLLVRLHLGLTLARARLGADIIVVPAKNGPEPRGVILSGEPSRHTLTASALERAGTVEGVKKASSQLFLRPAPFTCCGRTDVLLVAVDQAKDFTIGPWVDGRRVPTLALDQIIVGGDIPVLVGDTILFFGTAFHVAATLERTGSAVVDRSVFMTVDAAREMAKASKLRSPQPLVIPPDALSVVLIEVEKGEAPERVALRIEHAVSGVRAETANGAARSVKLRLDSLKQDVVILIGVLWLLSPFLILMILRLNPEMWMKSKRP